MNKIICFLIIILISGPTLAEDIKLIAGGEEDSLEMSMGKKLVANIGKRKGINIVLVFLPRKRALLEFIKNRNKYHGAYVIPDEMARKIPDLFKVEEPVYKSEIVAISLNNDIKINGWESLRPYRLSHVRGSLTIEIPLKKANLKSYQLDSAEQIMLFLLKRRADIFITIPLMAEKSLNNTRFKGKGFKILKPPLSSTVYHTYFYGQYSDIAKKYNDGLIAAKKDGTYLKIITATE